MKNGYNLPRKLERFDYEACVELVRKDALDNPTVSSVYLMGGDWCPGISDLDILVVYKDGLTPLPLRNPWSLSEKARFIFTHRYLSFDQSSAEYFHFLYPKETASLRNIVGAELEFLKVPDGERQWILAFILFDTLVNKLLFFSRFKKPPHNIRQLIGSLYSLVYTVWIVHEVSGVDIDQGFGERIQRLRQDWFVLGESSAERELMTLLDQGILLVSRAVTELDSFVSRQNPKNMRQLKFSNDKFSVMFVESWTHKQFLEEFSQSLIWDFKKLGRKVESFRLLLPASCSIFFQAYAEGEGEFSRIMRQHLSGVMERIKMESLRGHVRAVNMAYESSLASGGLFKIPYSYGFFSGKRNFRSKLFWRCCSFLRDLR